MIALDEPPAALAGLVRMLAELESHKLEVQLAPLNPKLRGWNEGGMKRVVCDRPPKFYRLLCSRHPSSRGYHRGFDTRIKRANVLALLRRLSTGLPSTSKYADEIRRMAG